MNNAEILKKIFRFSKGFETEILLEIRDEALTRFADNEVSQNVRSLSTSAQVKIMKDGRLFKFTINQFDDESLKKAVAIAAEGLKFQKPDAKLLSPLKKVKNIKSESLYNEETAALPPAWRAEKIKMITSFCRKKGILSYGILSNGFSELCVANSSGVLCSHKESLLDYKVTVKDGDGYGAYGACSGIPSLDFQAINERALKKAGLSKNPVAIKPGKYTVVFEEAGAADLVSFVAHFGFNGLAYAEKRSFVSENLGKRFFGPEITIVDDALGGPAASMPFDFEGHPKERVELVKNGVIKNIVTDRNISRMTGFLNTGHSLPQPNAYGPIPLNVSMETGPGSLEDMIRNTEDGILVTELHYTNCLKPKTVEMTGMTRNGTFLIKNGKISKGVKNMRFTMSALEALKNVEEISNKALLFSEYIGRISVPALKIREFNFSSVTEF